MGKIAALKDTLGDAVLVHLYRHPAAFVSSNLLPSDRHDLLGLRGLYNRKTFFTRQGGFNGWGMEELSRTDHAERTGALLAEAVRAPAAARRGARPRRNGCWRCGSAPSGSPSAKAARRSAHGFVPIAFEDLCADPAAELATIHAAAGAEARSIDTSRPAPGCARLFARRPALARVRHPRGLRRSRAGAVLSGHGCLMAGASAQAHDAPGDGGDRHSASSQPGSASRWCSCSRAGCRSTSSATSGPPSASRRRWRRCSTWGSAGRSSARSPAHMARGRADLMGGVLRFADRHRGRRGGGRGGGGDRRGGIRRAPRRSTPRRCSPR